MSLEFSIQIFWPVLVAGVAAGGAFLATIAIVDGLNAILAWIKP